MSLCTKKAHVHRSSGAVEVAPSVRAWIGPLHHLSEDVLKKPSSAENSIPKVEAQFNIGKMYFCSKVYLLYGWS